MLFSNFLQTGRDGGEGGAIPWPGQLAPWGEAQGGGGGEDSLAWKACPPPMETANSDQKIFNHFKHVFNAETLEMNTCLYLLFSLWEGIRVNILWPKKFALSLRKSCK